jgi:Domain of unknown function (DUF892)
VRKLCEEGVEYTEERIRRLDKAFAALGAPARGKTCHAMAGLDPGSKGHAGRRLQRRGEERCAAREHTADLALRYPSYGTVCSYAKAIGADDVAGSLAQSRREKKEADEEMTELAESEINRRALQPDEDDGTRNVVDKAAAGIKPRHRGKSTASRAQ